MFIFIGGGFGALMRYYFSGLFYSLLGSGFPWGTFLVNCIGCFLIGFCWIIAEKAVVPQNLKLMVLTGFLGAFTTFSTYSLETFRLLQDNEYKMAFANVAFSTIVGLVCVYFGVVVARTMIYMISKEVV